MRGGICPGLLKVHLIAQESYNDAIYKVCKHQLTSRGRQIHNHNLYRRGESSLVLLAVIVRNLPHEFITLEVCLVAVSLDVSSASIS